MRFSGSEAAALIVTFAGAPNVAPAAGAGNDTDGRLLLPFTVIDTADDVVMPPSLSDATAVNTCEPAGTDDHEAVNGGAVAAPMKCDPSKNSTRARRFSGSDAEALIASVSGVANTAPSDGAVIGTTGGGVACRGGASAMLMWATTAVAAERASPLVTANPTNAAGVIGTV